MLSDYGFWGLVGHWRGAPVPGQAGHLSFVFALYQGDVGGVIQSAAFCELLAGGAVFCAVEYPFAAYGALTDHDRAPLVGEWILALNRNSQTMF